MTQKGLIAKTESIVSIKARPTKGYDIPAKNYYAKKKEEKKILNAWFPDTK